MLRHVVVVVVVVAVVVVAGASAACSLWVDDELTKASAQIGGAEGEGAGEGEGEGEGEGGEGEGEGGEGEGEGEGDPACESRERLVVVTSDPENPLQAYQLVDGGLVPLAPTGFLPPDGALTKDNGDPAGTIEAAAFDAAGATFYVADSNTFYAVSSSTLLQVDVRAPERTITTTGFGSMHGLVVTPGFVVGVGADLQGLNRTGAVGSGVVELATGSFHAGVAFVRDDTTFVAANSERGYSVLATGDPNGQPVAAAGADDDSRFGNFGGSQARRGLAYDGVTGSLLLGDEDGVIVAKAPAFALPTNAGDDYVLPQGSFVSALGARSGKGYVANGSGDVYELDLTTTPPTTIEVSSWDTQATAGIPQQIVVGCKRIVLVVGGFGGPTIFNYDRDTLEPYGGGPEVHDVIDALLVDKDALALDGDT